MVEFARRRVAVRRARLRRRRGGRPRPDARRGARRVFTAERLRRHRCASSRSWASSCASSTARSPTSPTSSRSCARPRPRRSAACSAPTSSGWRPSPTATASAPPASPRPLQTDPKTAPTQGAGMTSIEELNPELKGIGTYEFGWSDSDAAGATAKRGLNEDVVRDISAQEVRAAVDARPAPEGPQALPPQADADLGLGPVGASTSTTSSTSSAPARSRRRRGTTCPRTSRTPTTSSASRRRRSSASSPVSPRSTSPRSSTTRSARTSRSRASSSSTPTPRCASTRSSSRSTSAPSSRSATTSSPRSTPSVWSGGSFIYVPKGVHVDIPLQAYFRINTENMGQFERTLIIVDEDAYVHYVEGCTAPIYSSDSLHSAVVEIIVKKGGRCRYTTIQNWSNNVYNLVTKRADLRGRRHDGVGRRQHRLQGDDEVPRHLPDGRARQGRDAVDRVRRRGPAPGRRRQDGARGAAHLVVDPEQVGGARRRPYVVPRPDPDQRGRARLEVQRAVRRAAGRPDQPLATPTPTSTSARTTCRWATRRASPRSPTTSSST